MSLKEAVEKEVGHLCGSSNDDDRTLRSVRLEVLARTAEILRIPFDSTGGPTEFFDHRIVLSPETFRSLDAAWCRLTSRFSDDRISNQERRIRERLFSRAPHYVERAVLSRFLNLLAKRDATVAGSLKTTTLVRLLAADGFRGILPHQCRLYANHLSDRLPDLEKRHAEATRALYDHHRLFRRREGGTTAAGLVLLALLETYRKRVGPRLDRATLGVVRKAETCVTSRIREEEEEEEGKKKRRRRVQRLADHYLEEMRRRGVEDASLDALAFRKLIDYGREALAKYLP